MKTWHYALLSLLIGLALSAAILITTAPPRGTAIKLLPAPTPAPLTIHIDGAVAKPGVYLLPRGSRVQNAVQAAGGFREDASTASVNLAASLKDGEKIVIPIIAAPPVPGVETTPPPLAERQPELVNTGPLNLNTATVEDLDSLPGIGPAIAGAIIKYREEHGDFQTIEEIQNVSGIGAAKFEQIKDLIAVE